MATVTKPKPAKAPKPKVSAGKSKTLVAGENLPPSMTSQTLPDGIAHLDPDARAAAADAQAQPPEQVQLSEVKQLRVDWLARHPRNRKPKLEVVAERGQSMRLEGQLEPIIVREWEGGPEGTRFQILSGETRWQAAQFLKWETIAARVVQGECDDARALDLLALYNGQRTDLDPIEKARMIEDQCQAGRTREEAARHVGLNSGSAASNLVRLLELPQVWQDRVAVGELPESFARVLLPFVKAPRLMKLMDNEWAAHLKMVEDGDDQDDTFISRGAVEFTVKRLIEEETRPIEPGIFHNYSYSTKQLSGLGYQERHQPRLFDITDELLKELEVIEVTVQEHQGKKPKSILMQRATNVELYDKLNIPLILKAAGSKAKGKANKSAAADEKKVAAKKALTPAEQRAKDKERAVQLENRIEAWRHRWLCEVVSKCIDQHPHVALRLVLVLVSAGGWPSWEICEAATSALAHGKGNGRDTDRLWKEIVANPLDAEAAALTAICRYALARTDSDPKHPRLGLVIDDLAAWCEVDLEEEWHELKADPEHVQLVTFLALHNGDQLDALGKELGVFVEGHKGKVNKVQAIETAPRSLPMPKSIRPLPTAEKAPAKPAAKKKAKGAR